MDAIKINFQIYKQIKLYKTKPRQQIRKTREEHWKISEEPMGNSNTLYENQRYETIRNR